MDSLKYGLVWAALCYVVVESQPLETVIGKFSGGPFVQGTVSVIDENTLQIKDYNIKEKGKLTSNQKLHNV